MPNHFSAIGFNIETEDDLNALITKIKGESERIAAGNGYYARWSSEPGIELWTYFLEPQDSVWDLNPYFSGRSSIRVGLTDDVGSSSDRQGKIAVTGWADPTGDDPTQGDYPFVFDVPDRYACGKLDYPFISTVRLSAFADELYVYDSEEQFSEEQFYERQDQVPGFAPESFIPSGTFGDTWEARAIFSGRVLETDKITNSMSGNQFVWAHVKTLGGTIDVVSDPALVTRPIQRDGIIWGSFWLCGRILKPRIAPPGARPLWRRIFGRS